MQSRPHVAELSIHLAVMGICSMIPALVQSNVVRINTDNKFSVSVTIWVLFSGRFGNFEMKGRPTQNGYYRPIFPKYPINRKIWPMGGCNFAPSPKSSSPVNYKMLHHWYNQFVSWINDCVRLFTRVHIFRGLSSLATTGLGRAGLVTGMFT